MFAAFKLTAQSIFMASTVPIIELVSYGIIGIATVLIVGTVIFLSALNIFERIGAWRIEKTARKLQREG